LLIGRKGVIGSMRYSANLIRGNWWRTVMIYTVAVTMIIVLSVTAGMIVGVLAAFGAARDLAVTTAVSAVMVVASGAIYMPFITAMTLSLYGDLQARREGIDLERRIAGAAAS
jgi:ubiquinone biosynthesis protein UbiJ